MKNNIPSIQTIIQVVSLYFFISGCGETDSGCTTHSTYQNSTPHQSVIASDTTGNIDKSAVPLSVSIELAKGQNPTGISVTGGINSSLRVNIPVGFEQGQSKDYSIKAGKAFFAPQAYQIRDSNENLVFESKGSPRVNVLGWSSTKSIVFMESEGKSTAVDLSTLPAKPVLLGGSPSLRADGTILILSSPWPSGQATLFDESLKALKSFSVASRYVGYDQAAAKSPYSYVVTVTDANGVADSSPEYNDSGYDSIDLCLSSDEKELQITNSLYYHLEKKVFLTGNVQCDRSTNFGSEDPLKIYHTELRSPLYEWTGTLTVKTISKDLETETYDWKCEEKTFTIGKIRAEYSLTLKSEAGDEVKQSGTVGIDLAKPNCESHYSGG